MHSKRLTHAVLAVLASVALVGATAPARAQAPAGKAEKLAAQQTYNPRENAVIWRDPGDVARLDWTHGPGGHEKMPAPPFTFKEEDLGGSNPKLEVTDAKGRKWGVKWGSEVNAEVFASRMAWAAGYFVEPTYFVASGKIQGVDRNQLKRAKKFVGDDGSFTDARFELKEKPLKKFNDEESWAWDDNPFTGTRELKGLKVILMLTSNWDSKDLHDVSRGSNTAVFVVDSPRGPESRYLFTDWGGSMGKWGGVLGREKWDCKGFAKQTPDFIKGVENGTVKWGYSGQRTKDVTEGITVDDVRWIVQYVGQITDDQLRDGLRAAGAAPDEVECFTRALRDRINQLKNLR